MEAAVLEEQVSIFSISDRGDVRFQRSVAGVSDCSRPLLQVPHRARCHAQSVNQARAVPLCQVGFKLQVG